MIKGRCDESNSFAGNETWHWHNTYQKILCVKGGIIQLDEWIGTWKFLSKC